MEFKMLKSGCILLLMIHLLIIWDNIEAQNLDPRFEPPPREECRAQATCEPLLQPACMGAKLPYTHTSIILANDSNSQAEALKRLELWQGLRNVPRCWDVVQPLLCSTYLPKCNSTGNYIELPSREICEITREPCKIVESTQGWPDFLKCGASHFPKGCNTQAKSIKFNTTGKCERPLVPTDNKDSWYKDVDGCGIQCQNPLFTDEEHAEVHIFVGVMATLCLMLTLIAVLTFVIDWKNANKYPSLILFFINLCFFIGSIGWLAQFIPGAREDIVCRADGTLRQAEPGSGETASCTIVFIIVYYSMMAGITWFVILAYSWHLTFKVLGTPRNAIEGKKAYFHIVAWSLPLVLTIICLSLTQIDGDSLSGICFVGSMNHAYRGVFVLLPVGVVVGIGAMFLLRGLFTLCKIQLQSPGLISSQASAKIRNTIIKIGLFTGFALSFAMITLIVHVYIFVNEPQWHRSFEEYIICEADVGFSSFSNSSSKPECVLESRPNLAAMEVHIFAYFGSGIVMSAWIWTKATLDTWKRFFRKIFRLPTNEPVKLRKHKMIAQAFTKRKDMQGKGRIDMSFHSTHDDPLGMKLDMNSVTSLDMPSTWAAAIPRFITRRDGMVHPTAGTLRRYSDSDVQSICSFYNGHAWEPPRKESIESRVSVEPPKRRKKLRRIGKNRVAIARNLNSAPKQEEPRRRGATVAPAPPPPPPENRRKSSNVSFSSANIPSVKLSIDLPQNSKTESEQANQLVLSSGSILLPATTISEEAARAAHISMFTASSYIQKPKPQQLTLTDLEAPTLPDVTQTSYMYTKPKHTSSNRRHDTHRNGRGVYSIPGNITSTDGGRHITIPGQIGIQEQQIPETWRRPPPKKRFKRDDSLRQRYRDKSADRHSDSQSEWYSDMQSQQYRHAHSHRSSERHGQRSSERHGHRSSERHQHGSSERPQHGTSERHQQGSSERHQHGSSERTQHRSSERHHHRSNGRYYDGHSDTQNEIYMDPHHAHQMHRDRSCENHHNRHADKHSHHTHNDYYSSSKHRHSDRSRSRSRGQRSQTCVTEIQSDEVSGISNYSLY